MKSLKQPIGASALLLFTAFMATTTILARAQDVTETQTAEGYTVTLKMLPAEAFSGPNATMERESGAKPNDLVSPNRPNHHLVVFITKDGQPVTDATVEIRYRHTTSRAPWMNLPVVRMKEKGRGPETTHFGNNLNLNNGEYDVEVIINRSNPIMFQLKVTGSNS